MRCIVHIGTEKTGTTAIQTSLERNYQILESQKVLYPKFFFKNNHPKVACYAMDDETIDSRKKRYNLLTSEAIKAFRQSFKEDFERELQSSPETVFIVNEHLSRLRKPSEVERLKELLVAHFDDIKIVIYLRRQDRLMRSMYSTVIKVGGVRENVYPTWPQDKERDFTTFDFRRILDLWSGVWGKQNISVQLFDRQHLHKQDVVFDFLNVSKVTPPDSFKSFKVNESLSAEGLLALRALNQHVPPEHRGNLGILFGRFFTGHGMPVSKDAAQVFLSHFEDGNNYVAKEYFDREQLFDPIGDDEYPEKQTVDDLKLSTDQMVEIFSKIWTERMKQYRKASRVKAKKN